MEWNEENRRAGLYKGLPAWASIVIYLILFLFLSAIAGMGVSLLTKAHAIDSQVWLLLMSLGTLVVVLFSTWIMLCVFDRRPFSDLGFGLKGRWKDLLAGGCVAAVLYAAGFGLLCWLGEIEVVRMQWNVASLSLSFLTFVLVAFSEEIMTRGYILGRLLHTRLNRFAALAISSLLFSLLHVFNPNVAFLPLLNIWLAGCLLGASYLYTRNLWLPISLHLFWNWIQGPVLGYSVSGYDQGGSLLTLRMPKDTLLNGGAFGFEGSLLCTLLLVVATVLIIVYFERRTRKRGVDYCSTPAMDS